MFFSLWLLQGAQRIVCPPRVFVPSGAWDVVPCSLRLWHLLRIPALLLRARRAHLALQVLRFLHVLLRVFPCLFIRHSLGLSIGAVLDRWRVIELEVARRIPSRSSSATVRGFLVLLTQKISLLPLPP